MDENRDRETCGTCKGEGDYRGPRYGCDGCEYETDYEGCEMLVRCPPCPTCHGTGTVPKGEKKGSAP